MSLVPQELSGHALGLHSSGMLAMQGVGAALAGAVATRTSPSTAMALMAVVSIAVTLWLAPGLRGSGGTGGQQPPQSQHSQHSQHSSASQQSPSQQSMSLHGPWRRRPLQGSS
jgi:hypothetical protein